MKTLFAITLMSVLGSAPTLSHWQRVTDEDKDDQTIELVQQFESTFATIEVTIDPLGKPMGAYQFELASADASFVILGVEGGDHAAFDHGRPPFFDPVAVQGVSDRLILAEYALPDLKADALPTGPIVVARVAVMFEGNEQPEINLTLTAAGDADGQPIQANATSSLLIPERPQ